MKTCQECPKCGQVLESIGLFGLVMLARCNCDYAAPGAEDSKFWRGVHVMDPRWQPGKQTVGEVQHD